MLFLLNLGDRCQHMHAAMKPGLRYVQRDKCQENQQAYVMTSAQFDDSDLLYSLQDLAPFCVLATVGIRGCFAE